MHDDGDCIMGSKGYISGGIATGTLPRPLLQSHGSSPVCCDARISLYEDVKTLHKYPRCNGYMDKINGVSL